MQYGKRLTFKFSGVKLHDLRVQRGLSQSQLAKLINSANPDLKVSTGRVGKWEQGRANPTFEAMRELSYMFGVKDDYWKSDSEFKPASKKEEPVYHLKKKFALASDIEELETLCITLDDRLKCLERTIKDYEEKAKELEFIIGEYKQQYSRKINETMDEIGALRKSTDDMIGSTTFRMEGLEFRLNSLESSHRDIDDLSKFAASFTIDMVNKIQKEGLYETK